MKDDTERLFLRVQTLRMFRLFLAFAILFGLSLHTASAADARADYALGPGDVVKIGVYDHPDLTAEARISEAGTIQFPLLGEVNVRGRTAAEAAERLAKQLEDGGFIKKPQVTVIVAQFRSQQISVLGYVARPGKYPIERASTVTDLIALAGSLVPTAADIAIYVTTDSKGATQRSEIDLKALFEHRGNVSDPLVKDGDSIYVPREDRYYIYGEVQRAGVYRLERKMSVMQALVVAGGTTLRGTQDRIKVNRRDAAGQLTSARIKLDESVLPDDVLYVSESLF